jgi:ribosomal protein S2
MKIEILKNNKHKLLKLKLIKLKILKKKHFLTNITLENIELKIKKVLYLIYLYHLNNKRIIFIGNPLSINKELTKIFLNTKHIFIPKSSWIAGVITNQYSSFKSYFKQESQINKISKRLLQLKKRGDLIVIIDHEAEVQALNESYIAKLPVILINSNLPSFDEKSDYKIPVNLISSKHKINNNLFYSLLLTIIKKAQLLKKKFSFLTHKIKVKSLIWKKHQRRGKKFKYDIKKKKSFQTFI